MDVQTSITTAPVGARIAAPETEILSLFRQWAAAEADMNRGPRRSEAEFDRMVDANCELADRIAAIDITGPADFAAKYLAVTTYGSCDPDVWRDALAEEAALLLGTTIDDLKAVRS